MEGTWVTRGGVSIPMSEMSNDHIINAVKMIRKNDGFIPQPTLEFYLGDKLIMALAMALKERSVQVVEELTTEAARRGLDLSEVE